MQSTKFKPIFMLALLFPLIGAVLGYFIGNIGQPIEPQTVSSISDPELGEIIEIYKSDTAPAGKAYKRPGALELGLFLALVCGSVAVIYHYLKNPWAWVVVFVLALVFSLIISPKMGVGLSLFFLANLALAALMTLMIKFLFFLKAITRFRMILSSLLGAGQVAVWYRGMYFLTKRGDFPSWSSAYVNALLMFVFIAYGLTLADLFIQRVETREIQASRASDDEDEDA
ncbi:MAG: hypothetical protein WCY21_07095 [Candidatus Cloacimonadaceae bacterium]|jgi:hypothetical protein|nr:hypothetical protein [Candidatus Cloacimonadota bacterium]MDX9950270.1 hypothetical protein [Candidatus Syntrophosphaera sp.]NLN85441.1 hypothetical protein [Candidatus Cloacimonadota bacterium]